MNHRYSQRTCVNGFVTFTVEGITGEGRILDLTVPGCMVESSLSPRTGDCITLRLFISRKRERFDVSMGIVRWAHSGRFGVEFIAMDQKDRLRFNRHLARCLHRNKSTSQICGSQLGVINWHLEEADSGY